MRLNYYQTIPKRNSGTEPGAIRMDKIFRVGKHSVSEFSVNAQLGYYFQRFLFWHNILSPGGGPGLYYN